MAEYAMILNLFGEGGGAGAAPAADGAGGEAAVVQPGVLEDGTQVDNRLAARMEEQARKRARRGEAPVQVKMGMQAQPAQETQPEAAQEPSLDDQYAEFRKKFKDQIGRDIKAAVDDRFKNQKDLGEQLAKWQPVHEALMKKTGAESEDDLIQLITEDDSLYEEDAENAGMSVEAYKQFKALQDEHNRREAEDRQRQEQAFINNHIRGLVEQGEKLKQIFPDFDLQKEMQDPTFMRLTAPNSGLSLEAAYYAVHHNELAPQAMAYGIQRATQQISQTIQANHARPVEGAMQNGKPADVAVDPRSISRAERQKLIERARRGEKIVL